MTQTELVAGPVDYVVVEFPGARFTGEALGALVDLVDRGIIRILDLRVVKAGENGQFEAIALTDVDGDGELDLAVFEGVESGLIDDDDIAESAGLIGPGDAVAVLLYENTWAEPFVTALRHQGADVIASGRLSADDLAPVLGADD